MYCEGHTITGMIAHGEPNTLVGHRRGRLIHLPLHRNERIISVRVRTPHDSVALRFEVTPTILVTTNHDRTLCLWAASPSTLLSFTQVRMDKPEQVSWLRCSRDLLRCAFGIIS